jgi:hypothetical protein
VRGATALGRLLPLVAIVALTIACGRVTPAPSGSGPGLAATEAADASTDVAASTGPHPPDLLITAADGSHVIVSPLAPSDRRPLQLPDGTSAVTTGPASVAAYTTDPSAATRIVLGSPVDDHVTVDATITAPAGERWGGTYPACLNGAGLVILADSGLRLSLVAPGEDPAVLPGQGLTRGHCVWPDDGHVIWDEQGDRLQLFDLDSGATFPVDAPPFVKSPSGGSGRMAGITGSGQLVVATYQLDGISFQISRPGRAVAGATTGELTPDGRWLVAVTGSNASVIDVTTTSWTPIVSIPLAAGDRIDWMPRAS